MTTIANLFLQSVDKYPDRTALVHGGRRWTYEAWYQRILRFAGALAEMGVRPTDRVAFYLNTSEASATTYLACQLLGAVAVPMNFRLASGEVSYILRDSGARVLVYGCNLQESVLRSAESVSSVHAYIAYSGDPADLPSGHRHFDALAEQHAPLPSNRPDIRPEHLSALVYTSGTTGKPKGVMHSHANDVAIAQNCTMEYKLSHRDIALHIAPLYHVGGMQAYFIPHMMVGAANVVMERYEAQKTLETIEAERITTLFAVPTQIQEMLFHPRFPEFNVSSLRMITTGGAAIASSTMQQVIERFCPNIYNGYGMTEASLTLLLHPDDALRHLGSCGKPTLITNCRIARVGENGDCDPDDLTGPDEVGQLLVRGPQMTAGYWNNPLETSKKLRNGWLLTGDLFSRDAEGFYTFRGRADDMIVSGGENIYPREIEDILYRCPGVQEAAVVGIPDPKWGSVVTAFIIKGIPDLTAEAIDQYCRASQDLAPFKRPKRIVFVNELPINPSGKVLKRELVARYSQEAA
jgi:long-chain acyl-CoA synthetase